ncbi:MAG: DUF4910 domain-containing protein [Lachnospiraceae bacterium]|nr:DUF4910 domain-containing protein [Lachnospiraceae bacterium]
MNQKQINQIFTDTAYVRMGGSESELKCANYLKEKCEEMGLEAHLEAFEVDMAEIEEAELLVDGKVIPCKGYFCCGSGEVTAPLYYMPHDDAYSLENCKGKIVLNDIGMGYWRYQDLRESGAVGFITYDGNANYADEDIDQKELRSYISKGEKMLGVNINAKQAIELVKSGAKEATIRIKQKEYKGESHNLVLELSGETEEMIVLTAHYDSTSLSQGAYDNMSGSIGLLAIAEKFAKESHRYGLRFIWCGSEERGLLGSKAYVAAHEEELKKVILNINLDMIGCIMGKFIACCTSEEKLVHYLEYLGAIESFGIKPYQDVYSSDSTPFADKGIPAVSFARIAPGNTATIHNSYDTAKVMSAEQMLIDIDFISVFTSQMANSGKCPVSKEIPENMKEKLDNYLGRKRDKKK